jgi:hypothetical protein
MLGKKGPRSASPPVSQVTLTTGLPNWQDGEHKDLSSRVLVVREMTTKMTCSAAIPQGMTVREMLQDYVSMRAYEESETKLPITFELVANGQLAEPAGRAIATHKARRTTLRTPCRDLEWARAIRPISH